MNQYLQRIIYSVILGLNGELDVDELLSAFDRKIICSPKNVDSNLKRQWTANNILLCVVLLNMTLMMCHGLDTP